MQHQPLISIIIPAYNRAHLIGETLYSIQKQTYLNWECLVIDDGSTDDTILVVEQYAKKDNRFQCYKRPDVYLSGGNGSRNYGFELSKGEYIQWFDSDDVMYPTLLEVQLKSILKNDLAFSLCLYDLYRVDTDELIIGKPQNLLENYYFDYISRHLQANLPTVLFSKKALNGFVLNEALLKSQEYEFLQRFFRENEQDGVLINTSLVRVVRHKESITEFHSRKKIASALDALLITESELPKESPVHIRQALVLQYLKTLYLAFTHRMTAVFYGYLWRVLHFQFFKGLYVICYTGLLYLMVNIFSIGDWHYKKIYDLYQ